MELTNDFTVNAPIDTAWETLTDVERIAPCLPGAQLTEIEGDTYRGLVKVKVGPITAQFKGQASFVEKDTAQHRAVLKAEGRDTGGKGNASALITAQLEPLAAEVTKVTVATDLTITGKVAQFGRGALADVSEKLLKQFVTNLESTVLTNGPTLRRPPTRPPSRLRPPLGPPRHPRAPRQVGTLSSRGTARPRRRRTRDQRRTHRQRRTVDRSGEARDLALVARRARP
jgi:carbon monoxide dehydrogenase subunit G